jgi:hypothetical protein
MLEILPIRKTASPPQGKKGTDVVVERPASGMPTFQDAVLYPGGATLELRSVRSAGRSGLRLTVKGAPRAALRPGALVLAPECELFVSRWAILRGECPAGPARLSVIPRPDGGHSDIGEVPCRLEAFGSESRPHGKSLLEVEADEAVPFLPGLSYRFATGNGECEAKVVASGPKPPPALRSVVWRELSGLDPADSAALEHALLELYGVAPRLRHGPADEPAAPEAALVFSHWLATEAYVAGTAERLEELFSVEQAVPVATARAVAESEDAFVPRTLWRELRAELEARLNLERAGGMLRTRGSVSPAERGVLETISGAGAHGEHVKSPQMTRARGVLSGLLEKGLVVKLANGRLYDRHVYESMAEIDEEIDDRRAAELWHVSRNTARSLIERMVRDGLLRRTSPRSAVPARRTGGPEGGRR